jgi:hypothetical protein
MIARHGHTLWSWFVAMTMSQRSSQRCTVQILKPDVKQRFANVENQKVHCAMFQTTYLSILENSLRLFTDKSEIC